MSPRLSMFRDMPIFGGVRDDILELLLGEAREVRFAADAFIFREDEPAETMFVLETGRVAILRRWEGIYYRLNYLEAGDCFGEMSFIDLGPRSASVVAATEATALELTHGTLMDVYQHDLEQFALIYMNVGRELSRRLRVADDQLFWELVKSNCLPEH